MTKVMRNRAMSPAAIKASRYPGSVAAVRGCAAANRLVESAKRAIVKTQRSPSSCSGVASGSFGLLFLDSRGFADLFAQVIQAAAGDDAALAHFDPLDPRAV